MQLTTIERRAIEFEGEMREYEVVDMNLPGAPRFFIGYNKGIPFVSDEVPDNYRDPMVVHELAEFELFAGQQDRCLNALKRELEIVPEDIRSKYVVFRSVVFNELIKYLEANNSDTEQIKESRKSLDYLQSLF